MKKTAFDNLHLEAIPVQDLVTIAGGADVKTFGINISSWGLDQYGNRVDKATAAITYTYTDEKDFRELRQFLRDNPIQCGF